jgi:hypothetical protein
MQAVRTKETPVSKITAIIRRMVNFLPSGDSRRHRPFSVREVRFEIALMNRAPMRLVRDRTVSGLSQ